LQGMKPGSALLKPVSEQSRTYISLAKKH